MIEMTRLAFAAIVLGAGMFGCMATIGLLLYCVQDDRRGRAKARRMRDHRVRG